MRIDDETLVEAVLAGRTECFATLVDRHAPAVFRLVRLGRDTGIVECKDIILVEIVGQGQRFE